MRDASVWAVTSQGAHSTGIGWGYTEPSNKKEGYTLIFLGGGGRLLPNTFLWGVEGGEEIRGGLNFSFNNFLF